LQSSKIKIITESKKVLINIELFLVFVQFVKNGFKIINFEVSSFFKFAALTFKIYIMSFNGNEGDFITLREGSEMTKRYRDTIQPGEVIAVFMGKEKIKAILDQSECEGIRFYFALNREGKKTLVLVGADSSQDDQIDGLIADNCFFCPSFCGNQNDLNS
jgi:hypothetical protein